MNWWRRWRKRKELCAYCGDPIIRHAITWLDGACLHEGCTELYERAIYPRKLDCE